MEDKGEATLELKVDNRATKWPWWLMSCCQLLPSVMNAPRQDGLRYFEPSL